MAVAASERAGADQPRRGVGRRAGAASAPSAEATVSWLESCNWTEEAYFALPDTNHLLELSDGRLVVLEMPTIEHQDLAFEAAHRLRLWTTQSRAGKVVVAPYPIRLWPGKIREPDVVFYRTEHLDRIHAQYGEPPDVALEVLSPSTRSTDLRRKSLEYARAGVAEYWVIDPHARWVELYALEGRRYRRVGRFVPGDVARSTVLEGFTLDVAELFAALT
jgi:Uma2 family endonuclease